MSRERLQFNPGPIRIVDAAKRDVWFRQAGWRCEHEDGRGRCTSTETTGTWNAQERRAEFYCERHADEAQR